LSQKERKKGDRKEIPLRKKERISSAVASLTTSCKLLRLAVQHGSSEVRARDNTVQDLPKLHVDGQLLLVGPC
jgi:hypothetical protein